MKTILLILLASTGCWAQIAHFSNGPITCGKIPKPYSYNNKNEGKCYFVDDKGHHEIDCVQHLMYQSLLSQTLNTTVYLKNLLLEYKKECWADSAQIIDLPYRFCEDSDYYLNDKKVDCMELLRNMQEFGPCKWDHKEPTFDGFMEWMEKTK